MTYNGLGLLLTIITAVIVYLGTRAYYVALLNEQRKINRLLRTAINTKVREGK